MTVRVETDFAVTQRKFLHKKMSVTATNRELAPSQPSYTDVIAALEKATTEQVNYVLAVQGGRQTIFHTNNDLHLRASDTIRAHLLLEKQIRAMWSLEDGY